MEGLQGCSSTTGMEPHPQHEPSQCWDFGGFSSFCLTTHRSRAAPEHWHRSPVPRFDISSNFVPPVAELGRQWELLHGQSYRRDHLKNKSPILMGEHSLEGGNHNVGCAVGIPCCFQHSLEATWTRQSVGTGAFQA